MEFAVPTHHRLKIKENEKKDNNLDVAKELHMISHLRLTEILIVIGSAGTERRGFVRRLEDLEIRIGAQIIRTSLVLRSTKILKSVLVTRKDLLSLTLHWKIISKRLYEKLDRSYNLIMNNIDRCFFELVEK